VLGGMKDFVFLLVCMAVFVVLWAALRGTEKL
jgi:hypothetical protein